MFRGARAQLGFCEQGASTGPRDSPWGSRPHRHPGRGLESEQPLLGAPPITPTFGRSPGLPQGESAPSMASPAPTLAEKESRNFLLSQPWARRSWAGTKCPVSEETEAWCPNMNGLFLEKSTLVPWPHSRARNGIPSDSTPLTDSVPGHLGSLPSLTGATGTTSPAEKAAWRCLNP